MIRMGQRAVGMEHREIVYRAGPGIKERLNNEY